MRRPLPARSPTVALSCASATITGVESDMRGRDSADGRKVANDYVIRVVDDPAAIEASAWDALLDLNASRTPFMRHAYLLALHRSQSAVAKSGWFAQFLAVHD